MPRTLKSNFFLCILLNVSWSLSAGWENWIPSLDTENPRIPVALLAASTCYSAYPYIKCILNYIRGAARLSANETASAYVTTVLRKRRAIRPNESVCAKYADKPEYNYAITEDLLFHIPRESSATSELKLLHAEARRKNHDAKKMSVIALTRHAVIFGLTAFLISHPLTRNGLMMLSSTHLIAQLIERYYHRHRARCADKFAILYAQNPKELESLASEHEEYHLKRSLGDCIRDMCGISIRPSDLERAQYFQKAADDLRKNLKTS